MDDLSGQIGQILSDPEKMRQLQSMAAALGLGGQSPASPPAPPAGTGKASPPPPAQSSSGPDLAGLLGALGNGQPAGAAPGLSPQLLQAVSRLAPLLNRAEQEDDSLRLLRSLRPLLGEAKQRRLDEAMRLLRVMRLLPMLRQNGALSGLL